jgi:uncharacterized protein YkwD
MALKSVIIITILFSIVLLIPTFAFAQYGGNSNQKIMTVEIIYATNNFSCSIDENIDLLTFHNISEEYLHRYLPDYTITVNSNCAVIDEITRSSYPLLLQSINTQRPDVLMIIGNVEVNEELSIIHDAYGEYGCVSYDSDFTTCLTHLIVVCSDCENPIYQTTMHNTIFTISHEFAHLFNELKNRKMITHDLIHVKQANYDFCLEYGGKMDCSEAFTSSEIKSYDLMRYGVIYDIYDVDKNPCSPTCFVSSNYELDETNSLSYVDEMFNFKIKYPQTWDYEKIDESSSVFFQDYSKNYGLSIEVVDKIKLDNEKKIENLIKKSHDAQCEIEFNVDGWYCDNFMFYVNSGNDFNKNYLENNYSWDYVNEKENVYYTLYYVVRTYTSDELSYVLTYEKIPNIHYREFSGKTSQTIVLEQMINSFEIRNTKNNIQNELIEQKNEEQIVHYQQEKIILDQKPLEQLCFLFWCWDVEEKQDVQKVNDKKSTTKLDNSYIENEKTIIENKNVLKVDESLPTFDESLKSDFSSNYNVDPHYEPVNGKDFLFSSYDVELIDIDASTVNNAIMMVYDTHDSSLCYSTVDECTKNLLNRVNITIFRDFMDSKFSTGEDDVFITRVGQVEMSHIEIGTDSIKRVIQLDLPDFSSQLEIMGTEILKKSIWDSTKDVGNNLPVTVVKVKPITNTDKKQQTVSIPDTTSKPDDKEKQTEEEIHRLVNVERKKYGLPSLSYDLKLTNIAKLHSYDMFERDYYAHESPEGKGASDRGLAVGYNCKIHVSPTSYYEGIGENLSKYSSTSLVFWESPESIAKRTVDGWMNSPPHKENILTDHYQQEGIGVKIGVFDIYATQNFC